MTTNVSLTGTNIGAMYNPFRYRGYYYDTETGLYYLNSRYYDPDTGRFINADGYLNANGDLIGFNMYAYCSNNPIMYTDPSGESISILAVFAGIAIGTLIGAIAGGVTAEVTGGDFWAGAAGGALSGFISTVETAFAITTGGFGGLVIAGVAGFGAGFGGSVVQQGLTAGFDNIDLSSALVSGGISAVTNIMCFGVSNFAMRESAGIFDNVIDKSGGKFFKRFIEGVSLSPEGLICTGMFSLPFTIANSIIEYIIGDLNNNENVNAGIQLLH